MLIASSGAPLFSPIPRRWPGHAELVLFKDAAQRLHGYSPSRNEESIYYNNVHKLVACDSNYLGVNIAVRRMHRTHINKSLISSFAFVHQPRSEIVKTLSFRIRIIRKHFFVLAFRTLEPLLACVEVGFYSTTGEVSSLHLLEIGSTSEKRKRKRGDGGNELRLYTLSR